MPFFHFSVLFVALAKTYSFAILALVAAGANCKCVWLLALALYLFLYKALNRICLSLRFPSSSGLIFVKSDLYFTSETLFPMWISSILSMS